MNDVTRSIIAVTHFELSTLIFLIVYYLTEDNGLCISSEPLMEYLVWEKYMLHTRWHVAIPAVSRAKV